MGFKVDNSFLRFLTMGALGVRSVAAELRWRGFEPIELERYCMSNKIWATKVKRLRLPDLLCVRTGLRVEVRAKSDLRIRMSDAPGNPDREWDAGGRDEDVVALIACASSAHGPVPAQQAVYFTLQALRRSVDRSVLGPPKAPSEGAERDRTWPSIVPTRPGRVSGVNREKLVVLMEGDGRSPRSQTYALNGKQAYVAVGDSFPAGATILAGAPAELANLSLYLNRIYNPLDEIRSANTLDRYAGVKSLRFRPDLHAQSAQILEYMLDLEPDERVTLEIAASAAAFGLTKGEDYIWDKITDKSYNYFGMEAILILSELKTPFSYATLNYAARWSTGEHRQAAIWGLGKAGWKAYADLLPYIVDDEENVAYHAITAFGPDTPQAVVEQLVRMLTPGQSRAAAAASEALRIIASPVVVHCLLQAIMAMPPDTTGWLLATLGRLPPDMVRRHLAGMPLLDRIEPMLLFAHGANWLATEDAAADVAFLLKQNL